MSKSDVKFFKSPKIHSLSIVVGNPDPTKGEVAPRTVDFVPYWERQMGVEGPGPAGAVKVGYLQTDEGSALKKLANDPNVIEVSEQDFNEGAAKENRAPY